MNHAATTANRPWDTVAYQRIVSSRFANGIVAVRFKNGDDARVAPDALVPEPSRRPDWANLRHEEYHLVVPAPGGEIEIPWDVIRLHTDPAFDAYWQAIATARATPAAGT